jgi:uncharacterized delta-60 repeat protein
VSGTTAHIIGNAKFALARLTSDGTLDATFGINGRVRTDLTSRGDYAEGMAIQADGKIVVVGGAASGPGKFGLARYNSDGTLDATFGGDGTVMTAFGAEASGAGAVAMEADGKIVAVGLAQPDHGNRRDAQFALARYNGDGTLDTSFGGDGEVETDFTSGFDFATGVAIQADGRVVVGGQAGSGKFALARYTSDGTLDATFGVNGKVRTDFTPKGDYASGLAIQTDGKIVVAGTGFGQFALARYNSDGSLDASFGSDGKVMTDFTPRGDGATDVAIQADGRILVAGMANSGRSKMKVALARYLAHAVASPSTAPAVTRSPRPEPTSPQVYKGITWPTHLRPIPGSPAAASSS